MSAEERLQKKLAELNLTMPAAPEPKGVYKPIAVVGTMVYLSGHLPVKSDGTLVTGCVGRDLDIPAGYEAARWVGLGILASLKKQLGSLDKVKRLVKTFGIVQCTPEFTQHPAVVNGCSELIAEVFGSEIGISARSAIGTNALPLGASVEVEMIFEI